MRLVVIGAGPGGYAAAIYAAKRGMKVTLIEKEHAGGTCLNSGCIPSKVMAQAAKIKNDIAKKASDFGISIKGKVDFDMLQLMKKKDAVIDIQRKGLEGFFQKHGIDYIKGTAVPGTDSVKIIEDSSLDIPYDHLILATGSRPMELPTIKFDGKNILSSTDVLCLEDVPKDLVIVGGGVIGCEFASIFSSFGSSVTIVEMADQILPGVDKECAKILLREMKKKKIKVVLDSLFGDVNFKKGKIHASISSKSKKNNITTDKVILCVGRSPNIEGLDLDFLSVRTDKRGWIITDKFMKTSNKKISAIGDILGPSKVMLAHVAHMEALVAVRNIINNCSLMNYDAIPNVIFTSPEIACVGMTEEQMFHRNIAVETRSVLIRELGKAHALGEIVGQGKIIYYPITGAIKGFHIIGPNVTEIISEMALAINKGITIYDIQNTIHPHPTISEIIWEISFAD